MRKKILLATLMFAAVVAHAQNIGLPPFLKWGNNNAPGCKNVFVTKDSLTLAVKNKCTTEGQLTNWRPSVNVTAEQLRYSVPAGAAVQLLVTYKFKPAGGDVFGFYGSFDPESDNSDVAFSRNLRLEDGSSSLPEAGAYRTVVLKVNFSNENDNPKWTAITALKGSMNFNLSVTTNNSEPTHQGSVAVVKDVKLIIK